jgi:hypothetical protein
MEKLVAEKLRKGYVESAGAPAAAAAPGPAPQLVVAPAPAPVAAPEPDPVPVPGPAPAPALDVTRSIALDPLDALWVTWRERSPLPLPSLRPFDRREITDGILRLQRERFARGPWRWDLAGAGVVPTLSVEGARFWLAAMLRPAAILGRPYSDDPRPDPDEVVRALEAFGSEIPLDLDALQTVLSASGSLAPEGIVPLAALLTPEDLVELLTRERRSDHPGRAALMGRWLCAGYRRYVLPYLSADEMARLRQQLLPRLDPAGWDTATNRAPNGAYYLGAMLGAHEPLRRLVEGWPDERFRGRPGSGYDDRPQEIIFGLGSAEEVERQMRRLGFLLRQPEHVRAWLAHTGYGALDLVRDSVLAVERREPATELCEALGLVVAPEAAPLMLELLHTSRAPDVAREWLDRHPAQAVAGLLPLAAGRERFSREAAEFLRRLSRQGQRPRIEGALTALEADGSLPAESAVRLRETLFEREDDHPLLDESSTPDWLTRALGESGAGGRGAPKVVPWARGEYLPPVLVGDRRLSAAQADALVGALEGSTLERPHPLVTAVKEHADRPSGEAFAWDVFEAWLGEGAPARQVWALNALGLLGGDRTALKLAPLIQVWPGEGQHRRAVAGLDCLRAIGTDTALMQINAIAERVKFKGLRARAVECMEGIARDRRLSRAELEDRIVPDCGLDAQGQRSFDFGPRRFAFALGPGMKPLLRDEAGALRPDLPRPNSRDDAVLAETAVAEWRLLKRQVAEVARVQALRLEQAMVTGRRWSAAELEALLVRHPLQTHLVRLLVWGTYSVDGKQLRDTFRVTEDLTYAGPDDATFELPPGATVGIVHPLHLDEGQRTAWSELLGDYEVVPPFTQLGRPLYRLEGGEAQGTVITRFEEVEVPAQALVFTLEKLGWQRGLPEDAGVVHFHTRAYSGAGVTAVVEYEDGVPVGYMEGWEDQRLARVYFLPYVLGGSPTWGAYNIGQYPQPKDAVPLGGVDAVAVSEVLSDLSGIVARAGA